MRAGKLDRVITIERQGPAENDGYGNPLPGQTWTLIATMRAQIIQATTEEFMRAWGVSSEMAIVFRTRFVDDVRLADRVTYDGRQHDIKEVKELGRRRGLEIRTARIGS
jgi:SPP1 family predicted phage head-tail adaptor